MPCRCRDLIGSLSATALQQDGAPERCVDQLGPSISRNPTKVHGRAPQRLTGCAAPAILSTSDHEYGKSVHLASPGSVTSAPRRISLLFGDLSRFRGPFHRRSVGAWSFPPSHIHVTIVSAMRIRTLPRKLIDETTGSTSAFWDRNLVRRRATTKPPHAQRITIFPQCQRLMLILTVPRTREARR